MNQKQKHFDICRQFPILCTNKCGVKDIPREKLEVHVRDECPATEVQCEYKNLGCEAVFPRSDAKSHSQTQIEIHLNLALRGLDATQHQVHELVSLVKEQSQQIDRQSGQIERLSEKIERLISKDKEQSEKMTRSMFTVQDQPPQRERRGPINQIFPTPFEWKIPGMVAVYQRSLRSQQTLSEPFSLFERGYKYLLRISIDTNPFLSFCDTPTGRDGLCVYIKVVPGEFDELLPWPCKEKVRVTLVNKDPLVLLPGLLSIQENKSDVIDFGEVPCSRPLHDDHHEYRFILSLNTFSSQTYINGNTTLIRVNRE